MPTPPASVSCLPRPPNTCTHRSAPHLPRHQHLHALTPRCRLTLPPLWHLLRRAHFLRPRSSTPLQYFGATAVHPRQRPAHVVAYSRASAREPQPATVLPSLAYPNRNRSAASLAPPASARAPHSRLRHPGRASTICDVLLLGPPCTHLPSPARQLAPTRLAPARIPPGSPARAPSPAAALAGLRPSAPRIRLRSPSTASAPTEPPPRSWAAPLRLPLHAAVPAPAPARAGAAPRLRWLARPLAEPRAPLQLPRWRCPAAASARHLRAPCALALGPSPTRPRAPAACACCLLRSVEEREEEQKRKEQRGAAGQETKRRQGEDKAETPGKKRNRGER
jgi:hypothetical protein